jgi:hypothetical protein
MGPVVSERFMTGSPAGRMSFTFPPKSRYALKNWAKRVSTNGRSPTEPSAPGVPVAATEAGAGLLLPPPHPTRRREVKIKSDVPTT